jgi:hypothetical protein
MTGRSRIDKMERPGLDELATGIASVVRHACCSELQLIVRDADDLPVCAVEVV